MIQEIIPSLEGQGVGSLTNSYIYGLDLSGTAQGAGTIGGILSLTTQQPSNSTTAFYCYDANGNVTDLVGPNGQLLAQYQFDPYGNTFLKSGELASTNPFRFSTKYFDAETGLYYYGYRYYVPEAGQWLGRDPIENVVYIQSRLGVDVINNNEQTSLYNFVVNEPTGHIDYLGLACQSTWGGVSSCHSGDPEQTHDGTPECVDAGCSLVEHPMACPPYTHDGKLRTFTCKYECRKGNWWGIDSSWRWRLKTSTPHEPLPGGDCGCKK